MFSQEWQGETYPIPDKEDQPKAPHESDSEKIYRVFTDVVQVKDFLTHPRFVLVDNREDADILWLREHFKDFRLVVCPLAVFPNILSNHFVYFSYAAVQYVVY